MRAIYNKNCEIVGWYEPQRKNVFGREMQWIGFVKNGYFFSKNARWIGALVDGVYVDKQGRPVAWIAGNTPRRTNALRTPLAPLVPLQPLTPLRPLIPLRPLRPLTPLGGWSQLEWDEYIKS